MKSAIIYTSLFTGIALAAPAPRPQASTEVILTVSEPSATEVPEPVSSFVSEPSAEPSQTPVETSIQTPIETPTETPSETPVATLSPPTEPTATPIEEPSATPTPILSVEKRVDNGTWAWSEKLVRGVKGLVA